MNGIQAIKKEKGLTAITVRDCVRTADAFSELGIRGVIMPNGRETVLITDEDSDKIGGFIERCCPSAVAESGIGSVTACGDSMLGRDRAAERILRMLDGDGISARFVSVSDTSVTVYLDERDLDRAWRILGEII